MVPSLPLWGRGVRGLSVMLAGLNEEPGPGFGSYIPSLFRLILHRIVRVASRSCWACCAIHVGNDYTRNTTKLMYL
jgi:hypothetical protein